MNEQEYFKQLEEGISKLPQTEQDAILISAEVLYDLSIFQFVF